MADEERCPVCLFPVSMCVEVQEQRRSALEALAHKIDREILSSMPDMTTAPFPSRLIAEDA